MNLGAPVDSDLSEDAFCEVVVRQNGHLEDAQDGCKVFYYMCIAPRHTTESHKLLGFKLRIPV